jgi:predicted DNA-binding transcriptional regulator YafY
MVDQIIDWFGKDIAVRKTDDEKVVIVSLWASPNAMEHWAMQYLNYVEVISPIHLRTRIQENLQNGLKKYE